MAGVDDFARVLPGSVAHCRARVLWRRFAV
jgi:hypothetical protein